MSEILKLNNVTKIFSLGGLLKKRRVIAVDNVSFSIPKGKPTTIALVGESGSGKTTVGRLVLGFIKPTSGKIFWENKDIYKMKRSEWKLYRRNVQAVFQDPYESLDPRYKVIDTLMEPLKKFKIANSRSESLKMISETIEAVGLRHEILDKYPHQISGGEKQRILLSRALLINAKLVVADEPVSMIDASLRASILNLMKDMNKNFGLSFLYITHDISTAYILADSIIVMYLGSIVESGSFEKVVSNPRHPYVKVIIDSIPLPDPKRRWKSAIKLREGEGGLTPKDMMKFRLRCKFCDRCAEAKEVCWEKTPPIIEIDKDHKVSCFLYA
jgi:peptide/nickel transport system ATP-binding protein